MYLPPAEHLSEPLKAAMASGHMRAAFSQLGEDGVLWWLFEGKKDGFYIDVGCYDPYKYSNTAALHLFNGWRGINIDVDQRAIDAFDAARPNDVNLCVGVGREPGQQEVTLYSDGAVNTFHPRHAADPHFSHLKTGTQRVAVKRLDQIEAEHLPDGQPVDFLNIDAEGLDYDVLESNDWARCTPTVIAIESHGFDLSRPTASDTFRFLQDKGYRLLSHVGVTSIYRKR